MQKEVSSQSMNKVVLVGTIPAEGKQLFHQKLDGILEVVEAKDAAEAIRYSDATYLVVRGTKCPAEVIDQLPDSVKMLSRWGVGYDSVDIEEAGKRGIIVTICTGGNAEPVAELAILLMLASYRKLPDLLTRAKEGRKDKEDLIAKSFLLQNKVIGLWGIGNIGSRVARMAHSFGATVQYNDAFRLDPQKEQEMDVTYVDLDTLFSTSDIISIHVPLLDSTEGAVNKDMFKKMKKNAVLINTARGAIVNTEDLIQAIETQEIAGAALDTVNGEPLPANHPIFSYDQILLTPHAGGNTSDNTSNMVDLIVQCILDMEHNSSPAAKYVVNQQYL